MEEQLFAPKVAPPLQQASAQLGNIATRLKLAEERYTNLQRRNQLNEESLLSFEKETRAEVRALTQQVVELRRHIGEINMKIDAMLGELQQVVPRHEFAQLERYVDLWQPMRFITREEAKRLIEDAQFRKLKEEHHA